MTEEVPAAPSLAEFLKRRREASSAPRTPVTEPPKPSSESPSVPREIAPAPKRGFGRQAAGALSAEVFKNTGQIGNHITSRVSGKGSAYSSIPNAVNAVRDASVALSKAGAAPTDRAIGKASSLDDIEKQIVLLDKQQRQWDQYFDSEIRSVRNDVQRVSVIATNAMKTVESMKRDARLRDFRDRAASYQVRAGGGGTVADREDGDPAANDGRPKAPPDRGLLANVWDSAKGYVYGGAATVGGGILARKGISSLLGKSTAAGTADVFKYVERPAVGSFAGRVAKSVVAGRGGGGIGLGIDVLKTMKDDSQSGNHLRTWLRNKLGIEDPGEAAPWQGAASNEDYARAKRDAEGVQPTGAVKPNEGGDLKLDAESVSIKSKKSIAVSVVADIMLEARNDIVLKGRTITLDAERITVRGKKLEGFGEPTGSTPKTQGNSPSLSASQQRYEDYVERYGSDKAKELIDKQENRWSDPMAVLKRLNPFSSGTGRGTAAPFSGSSPGSNLNPVSGGKASGGGDFKLGAGAVDPKEVYQYLREKGLDHEHAVGMLNNIQHESGFDPSLMGDRNTSGGLFQHHNERFTAMTAAAGRDWGKNWRGQVDYALSEGDTKQYLGRAFSNSTDASTYFTKNWERPSDAENRASQRLSTIGSFDSLRYEGGKPVKNDGTQTLADVMQSAGKPSAAAVDIALRNEGMHEQRDRQALIDYLRKGPNAVDPAVTPWCAAYVNSSLAQAGIKGTGSALAASFQRWGTPVSDAMQVQKGDVMVRDHHVGMATGNTRTNENGGVEVEMVSGNSSDRVRKTWEPAGSMALRRASDRELPQASPTEVDRDRKRSDQQAEERTPVVPGKPAGFEVGQGRIAGQIDRQGKLSSMATSFGRSQIIAGFGDSFDKLPPDVQDHLRNADQLDMNKLAPYARTMPAGMRAGLEREGLRFTDAVPDSGGELIKRSDAVPSSTPPKSVSIGAPPVQDLGGAKPIDDPATSDMARDLGADSLDASSKGSDAEMIRGIPTPPNLETNDDPDAGDRLTESVARDARGTPKTSAPDTGSQGSSTGSRSRERISAPVNHPESESPRPGTDGYGDKQQDPDDCGICYVG